ncbi:hypothetical protein [Aeromonas hydrophila]|uniref:hypothetical protein n=1 Tax=Aeromonas hydrophila TaxID=644 RepID=UPI002B47012F|nr:hypothetical protein [Aeromonas hydrophila]
MIKFTVAVIVSAFLFGCAKHENVSVDGRDTNRWKIVKDWNGQRGWIGATHHDGLNSITFEALDNEKAITFLTINSPNCNDELNVDGVMYEAKATKRQKSGYSECFIQVFGDDAFVIASNMALSDKVSFNGNEIDVRGFNSIMNNYFLPGGTSNNAFASELNKAAKAAGIRGAAPMTMAKYGNWKATHQGKQTFAGLKSISTDNAAIMVISDPDNKKHQTALAFTETYKEDDIECSGGIDINDKHFEAETKSTSIDGVFACTYMIVDREAEYALSLIGSKKTIYINGCVFDTTGFNDIKSKLVN